MWKKWANIISFLIAFMFGVGLCTSDINAATNNGSFWIEFIDVGQGDSTIIQCDGHYMMIDGGPSEASSIVYTILKNKGIRHIDYMIATHPDADHIGGLSGALNYASVGKCYCSVSNHDTKTFNSLTKYLDKQNLYITVPLAGEAFNLGSALVQIVGPIYSSSDTNNGSIVVKITYGKNSFIFMGDAEEEEELSIISARKDLACDVIKIGHHGSASSTTNALLDSVNPTYAVISVGNNSYGHPTAITLNKLIQSDIKIYRTDIQGDIICSSDGTNIKFFAEKNANIEDIWTARDNQIVDGKGGTFNTNTATALSIPSDTAYVININSKKFHLTTCRSVSDMSEKNTVYTSKSAEQIVAEGYVPCKRCNPYFGDEIINDNLTNTQTTVVVETPVQQQLSAGSYVLNANTKKFHYPTCSSVGDMSPKNRRDVNDSRDNIIAQGYVPCKRCNP